MQVKTTFVNTTTVTNVFTATADCVASVYVCNTGQEDLALTLWISSADVPSDGERVEHGAVVPPGGILERGGMPLAKDEKVYFQATVETGADVRVCGV